MREPREHSEEARGFALGAAAYGLWGLFPLYWPLLKPAGAIEILAHRVTWSLISMVVLVVALRRTGQLRAIFRNPRVFRLLVLASVVVAVNWGTYIWGVNHGLVVETSLGYFVNPLVSVGLGVLVLGERLRTGQKLAIGVAGLAVLVLSVASGRPPWLALVLAFSFGFYGLLKKQAGVGAVASLAVETAVLSPLAAAYLVIIGVTGASTFSGHGIGHAGLLATAGLVTAVPLLAFGAAATRVPLTTLGVLQYLAPTIQLIIGTALRHEPFGPARLAGFSLVWVALLVFTVDLVRQRRRVAPVQPELEPV